MMATAGLLSNFLPLLESLEDSSVEQSEQTDAYLTIANRLSGDGGRQFLPSVEKHFPRLGNAILTHITSPNPELCQAALQALGFCVYHSHVVSGTTETFAADVLTALCSLVVKSIEKNTCTRALWVLSKQSFSRDVIAKKATTILSSLENVWNKENVQSVVMEHEALNVIIRMLEQVPNEMGEEAVRWGKLVIPLVVHSASKVRLRAAAAIEMGMPLLLKKQMDIAAIIEPMMSSKLIPELQKLFMSKNETNVLKLWPLFVKLLGKLLHRGGPFINSLLRLEELGFRSSSPTIKKIAFIAWKSLIDNFALNPDILCSTKRLKLLMQPLTSINVRTEALLLTKVEVWWYLVVQLGPNLSPNFDQISVPLLQCTIGSDNSVPSTTARAVTQNGSTTTALSKAGSSGLNGPANSTRMSLNSSVQQPSALPSIQLLGLEMLLHYFLGPEVVRSAAKSKVTLSLEPLNHPLVSGVSSFTKHAAVLISNIKDGLINIGKDAPESLVALLWSNLIHFVNLTIESGSKKDRQGCEVLTLALQAFQCIVTSRALPADKVLVLFENTVRGIPHRVLGSASYQVGKMDVLNGTPALFLVVLLYKSSMLLACVEEIRFHQCLQALVSCGLSGPTSPLAFGEAVLGTISQSAGCVKKEQLLRMWSVVISPLTDKIIQSNEVNQGDALEHNFSAMHAALLFPFTHLLGGTPLQQAAQKSMLFMWSKLYKVFARSSALVVTAEENICCEEFCLKMAAAVDNHTLKDPSTLQAVSSVLQVMVECVDFSPYTPQFQQRLKSPHTPVNWVKKRNKALGNLSTFQSLLVQCLNVYLEVQEASEATGSALVSCLSVLFTNLVSPNAVKEMLTSLIQPLSVFYKQTATDPLKFTVQILAKLQLEKLLGEVFNCLQSCSTLPYDSELLALLAPLLCALFLHKNKQHHSSVTHFWNSTFAKSVSLTYPEELRPILNQVKQKTPIILPGFEAVSVADDLSGQYSSESSQLETKLSGIPVSSLGKRDSLLGKTTELKDKNSPRTVTTKLEFGSPRTPCREALEDEASTDFVFIPPETKERVLTEHQKEMKRTKRVDIPAMYNNLDASLDTTVFTQYTQSQDHSMEKLQDVLADKVAKKSPRKIPVEAEASEDVNVEARETQDFASSKDMDNNVQKQMTPESADISMVDDMENGGRDTDTQARESLNILNSSDLVSGTPPKSGSSSRRQPFITLEKYAEGKLAISSTESTFTGLPTNTPSRDHSQQSNTTSSLCSRNTFALASLEHLSSQTEKSDSVCDVNDVQESPRRPKGDGKRSEPVRLMDRMTNDTAEWEEVIPDTQTENVGLTSQFEEIKPSCPDEESQQTDSQSTFTWTPDEPRRSRRHRARPHLPGQDPEVQNSQYTVIKRQSGEECNNKSPGSSTRSRPNTRSNQTAQESAGRDRLRTRSQRDNSESSQTTQPGQSNRRIKQYSNSEEIILKPEGRTRRSRALGSSQPDLLDTECDSESQSQGQRGRCRKSSLESEEGFMREKILSEKVSTQSPTDEPVEQREMTEKEPSIDYEKVTSQTDNQSQESVIVEEDKTEEQIIASTLANSGLQGTTAGPSLNESEEVVKDNLDTGLGLDHDLSQEDSQATTPPSSSSQWLRGSRRKTLPGIAETGDKAKITNSSGRKTRSASQTDLSQVSHKEVRGRGRPRKIRVHQEQTKGSPISTPESSQSFNCPALAEISKGSGRYSTRKTTQTLRDSMEFSEPESPDVKEYSIVTKKTKSLAQFQRPFTALAKDEIVGDIAEADAKTHKNAALQSMHTINILGDSPICQTLERSGTLEVANISEEPNKKVRLSYTEVCVTVLDPVVQEKSDTDNNNSNLCSVSPGKIKRKRKVSVLGYTSSQESDRGDSESEKIPECDGIISNQFQPHDMTAADILVSSDTSDRLQFSGTLRNTLVEVVESADVAETNKKLHSDPQELAVPEENIQGQEYSNDGKQSGSESRAEVQTHLHASDKDGNTLMGCQNEETTQDSPPGDELEDAAPSEVPQSSESTNEEVFQDSPAKLKGLEAALVPDVVQSPSRGRTRGIWSPSASPSTSILKKAQKRSMEEDTPSPIVKSRRVSFANPIQQQETADDIDRRSPAIRTSSPRRPKGSSIPQPRYVSTPTKGLLMLGPRNLHSPGYRSSKKCLISEMSQGPRPVSSDCIYPGLVGCPSPVEAVLTQLSSNMWSRCLGQLVRARNIKTVGDLSALTPSEIKTLPIRSPKISNVKKALKIYQQQRKGRGVEELKSFDEMEMMTFDPEVLSTTQNSNEEEKISYEALATELVGEPHLEEKTPDKDCSAHEALSLPAGNTPPKESNSVGLMDQFNSLDGRMTSQELSYCSSQQLVEMHDQLGGMMQRVVVELQTRLCQNSKP